MKIIMNRFNASVLRFIFNMILKQCDFEFAGVWLVEHQTGGTCNNSVANITAGLYIVNLF